MNSTGRIYDPHVDLHRQLRLCRYAAKGMAITSAILMILGYLGSLGIPGSLSLEASRLCFEGSVILFVPAIIILRIVKRYFQKEFNASKKINSELVDLDIRADGIHEKREEMEVATATALSDEAALIAYARNRGGA